MEYVVMVVLLVAEGKRHGVLCGLLVPWGSEGYGEELQVVECGVPLDLKRLEPIGPQAKRDDSGLALYCPLCHQLLHPVV